MKKYILRMNHPLKKEYIVHLEASINLPKNGFFAVRVNAHLIRVRHAVKHLGTNVIHEIIAGRKQSGPYTTLEDFLTRVTTINKKALERGAELCT